MSYSKNVKDLESFTKEVLLSIERRYGFEDSDMNQHIIKNLKEISKFAQTFGKSNFLDDISKDLRDYNAEKNLKKIMRLAKETSSDNESKFQLFAKPSFNQGSQNQIVEDTTSTESIKKATKNLSEKEKQSYLNSLLSLAIRKGDFSKADQLLLLGCIPTRSAKYLLIRDAVNKNNYSRVKHIVGSGPTDFSDFRDFKKYGKKYSEKETDYFENKFFSPRFDWKFLSEDMAKSSVEKGRNIYDTAIVNKIGKYFSVYDELSTYIVDRYADDLTKLNRLAKLNYDWFKKEKEVLLNIESPKCNFNVAFLSQLRIAVKENKPEVFKTLLKDTDKLSTEDRSFLTKMLLINTIDLSFSEVKEQNPEKNLANYVYDKYYELKKTEKDNLDGFEVVENVNSVENDKLDEKAKKILNSIDNDSNSNSIKTLPMVTEDEKKTIEFIKQSLGVDTINKDPHVDQAKYEDLLKHCLESLVVTPNDKTKAGILKLFYQKFLQDGYEHDNFFEDLARYALSSQYKSMFSTIAMIRVSKQNVLGEIYKEDMKRAKFLVGNLDIEGVREINKKGHLDFTDLIESLHEKNSKIKFSESEKLLKKLDFVNYPWFELQKEAEQKNDDVLKNIDLSDKKNGRTQLVESDETIEGHIKSGDLEAIKHYKISSVMLHDGGSHYSHYIDLAAKQNNTEMVDYFLSNGMKPSAYALNRAMDKKNYTMFKNLTVHGANTVAIGNNYLDKNRSDFFVKKVCESFFVKEKSFYMEEELRHLQKKNLKAKTLEEKRSKKTNQKKSKSAFLGIASVEKNRTVKDTQKSAIKSVKNNLENSENLLSQNVKKDDIKGDGDEKNIEKKNSGVVSPFDIVMGGKLKNKLLGKELNKNGIEQNERDNIKLIVEDKKTQSFSDEIKVVNNSLKDTVQVSPKSIVNCHNEEVLVSELQSKWDFQLVQLFYNYDLKLNMSTVVYRFLDQYGLKGYELKESGIKLRRFPIEDNWGHSLSTPHGFVCRYLPNVADKLFKRDSCPSEDEIIEITKNFSKEKLSPVSLATKKFTIEERAEITKTSAKYRASAMERESYRDYKTTTNRNWKTTK